MALKITIDVNRAKAVDELGENIQDIRELLELIPDWQRHEAEPIARRIIKRHLSLISAKTKP